MIYTVTLYGKSDNATLPRLFSGLVLKAVDGGDAIQRMLAHVREKQLCDLANLVGCEATPGSDVVVS